MSEQTQLRLAVRLDILEACAAGEDPSRSKYPTVSDLVDELLDKRDAALAEAHAEIERLRARLEIHDRHAAKAEQRIVADLAAVAAASAEIDSLDPHGFYVYFLWGHGGDLLYIGKSTNLLARLGSHMGNRDRRHLVARITLVKCDDERSLARTEERLIRHYRPPLNIAGVA